MGNQSSDYLNTRTLLRRGVLFTCRFYLVTLTLDCVAQTCDEFWTTGDKTTGAQGWNYWPPNNAAKIQTRGNDGNKMVIVRDAAGSAAGSGLWGCYTTSCKWMNTTIYKTSNVANALWLDVFNTS